MPRPVVSDIAERMYAGLQPLAYDDHLYDYALLHYCETFIGQLQLVEDLVRDDPVIDAPGWSILLDIDRCPYLALPWLGQFVGVTTPEKLATETYAAHEARIREYIRATGGFNRGTVSSIIAAVQQFIGGTKEVILIERDSSPYHFQIKSRYSQTPTEEWPATNLVLATKSFEGGVTTGWAVDQSGVSGIEFGTIQWKYPGSDGSYVAYLNGTLGSGGWFGIGNSSTSYWAPVTQTLTYTASCYVQSFTSNLPRSVVMRLGFYDVSNVLVGSLSYGDPEWLASPGSVARPTATFEAPVGAVKCSMLIYTGDAGYCSIGFDAIQLEQNSEATPYIDGSRVAGATNVRKAIDAVKPAGLQYEYFVIPDFTYDDLNALYSTYNALDASAPTYDDLEEE
jgi:hypothetical protein